MSRRVRATRAEYVYDTYENLSSNKVAIVLKRVHINDCDELSGVRRGEEGRNELDPSMAD